MSEEWHHTTLGEIARLQIGRTPPRKEPTYWTDNLTHPFLSIGDMTGRVLYTTSEGVTQEALEDSKARLVPAGALLMSFKLTIGRIAFTARPMCTNEAIVWIDPKDEADTDAAFLALALEAADLTADQSRAVKGATLNKQSLSAIRLRIPSRDIQYRMVDLVDSVDRAISACDEVAEVSTHAMQAVRDDLLAGWETTALGQVLASIAGGRSVAGADRPPEGDEAAILKLSAVQPCFFDPLEVKALPVGVQLPDQFLLRSGDVLITRSNTPERVGYACHVSTAPSRPTYTPDLIYRLYPDPSRLRAQYLAEILNCTAVRAQIVASASGTSQSMQKINHQKLRGYAIPLPPLDAQLRHLDVLQPLRTSVEAARRQVEHLRRARTALVSSLMSGAHSIPDSYDRFLSDVAEVA